MQIILPGFMLLTDITTTIAMAVPGRIRITFKVNYNHVSSHNNIQVIGDLMTNNTSYHFLMGLLDSDFS